MRLVFLLIFALPLAAQDLAVPCEASPQTLRLLDALPPLTDISIPFESRIGALRTLAERNPADFFIQRAYQDSFRRRYHLAGEFDRALGMYRSRAGAMSRYYEARLLMYSRPGRSRATFEELLKAHPEFVWPHLEFVEWSSMPGIRNMDASAPHMKAFRTACPEALAVGERMLPSDDLRITRAALERRNSRLDLSLWPQLWAAEERAGIGAGVLHSRVRADVKRIQEWPFRPDPNLLTVYRESSRITKDPALLDQLRATVAREAPQSYLASLFTSEERFNQNPRPRDTSTPEGRKAYQEYQQKEIKAYRESLRKLENVPSAIGSLYRDLEMRARSGEPDVGSPDDLEIIDRFLRFRQSSPDAVMQFPPLETGIARVYVAGKVRLDQIPKLLDQGLRQVSEQMKYSLSRDLVPEEMLNRAADWQELTAQQTQQIRADYFLAVNQPADARSLVEQALAQLDSRQPVALQERGHWQYERAEWLRRLGNIDAIEGRVEEALAHYQASLGVITEESLSQPMVQQRLAPIRQYYLAHGGTDAKWLEWATEKSGSAPAPVRPAHSFLAPLSQFTAKDLAGKTWQLADLNGKATLVNFWATWCGPCRGEHPDIQKVYNSIRGRKDLQILTISVDDSPSAVTEYMKEKAYTFPVIHSPELAEKLFPYIGLPTNFLVNAKGIRTSFYGVMTGTAGVQRIMDDMETAAKAR